MVDRRQPAFGGVTQSYPMWLHGNPSPKRHTCNLIEKGCTE